MNPVLYILMRNDLPSMNAGKGMAQASHASNAFIDMVQNKLHPHDELKKLVEQWQNETKQGFGTVLVLSVSKLELDAAIEAAQANMFVAGKVTDPTYPYRVENGEIANLIPISNDTVPRELITDWKAPVTLYREEVTCGFIFGEKEEIEAYRIVASLKLHP